MILGFQRIFQDFIMRSTIDFNLQQHFNVLLSIFFISLMIYELNYHALVLFIQQLLAMIIITTSFCLSGVILLTLYAPTTTALRTIISGKWEVEIIKSHWTIN